METRSGSSTSGTWEGQIERELVRYVFTRGQGARLVFLWVAGAGLLLVVWRSPVQAGLWTALVVALAALILRQQRQSAGLRRSVGAGVLARRFSPAAVADPALRASIDRSHVLAVELLATTWEVRRRGGEAALTQVISDAEGLLTLQLESARQAEELERLVALVAPTDGLDARPDGRDGRSAAETPPLPATAEALRAMRSEGAEARANVEQVRQQLEALLLNVARLERRSSDLVATAQVTHGAGQTLVRLRDVVEARRRAASEVAELFAPEGLQR